MFKNLCSKLISALILIALITMPVGGNFKTQQAKAEVCNDFLPDFICDLTAPELAIGALGTFYVVACTPVTQIPTALASSITVLGTGVGSGPTVLGQICDNIKSAVGAAIKQQLINQAVNQILDWIEGGFQGPIFVGNWKQFLRNAESAAIGNLVAESDAAFLCSPINIDFRVLLAPVPRFSTKAGCTLDSIVNNISNFYDDFRNGGWLAYQESWSPQNNVYGLALLAMDEAAKQREEERIAAQNEALAGGGFLSQKDSTGDIKSPGKIIGDASAEVLIKTPIGSLLSANEISGYLGAIITALLNQLTRQGIDSLRNNLHR